jgi:ATPase subunit of ABC transporter with duplicated ATPase domains
LFGRNGEGKSTLLNIICGKLKHESGVVDLQRGSTLG